MRIATEFPDNPIDSHVQPVHAAGRETGEGSGSRALH
jgi:hypothetical protein